MSEMTGVGAPAGLPQVIHEARSRRRLIRVRMPLDVTIAERRFQVRDLSLGGFSLAERDAAWTAGSHLRARLAIPVERLWVEFEAECEVIRAGAADSTGFRFTHLSPDQLEFLRQVMDAFVTGKVVAVDAVLAAARGPDGERAASPEPHGPSAWARGRRLAGYALLLAAGAGLVGIAGLSLYGRILTVRSELAAVSGAALTVSAPRDGILVGALPPAGAAVAEGAPLLDLRHEELEADIRLAEAALTRQDAVLASLGRRHRAALEFISVYAGLADAALAEAQASVAGVRAELDAATRHADRTGALQARGVATEASLEAATRRKASAESALDGAQAAVAAARVNRTIAAAGRLFTGSRIDGHEPEVIAEELAVAEAERRFLERRLDVLLDQRAALAMTSPCACVVRAILRQSGEWVTAGTPLLQLAPAAGDLTVVAKIPLDQAAYLRRGGPAEILLADRAAVVEGRIADIRMTPPPSPRMGLPLPIDQDPRFASVEIVLHGAASSPVGTPAQAVFPVTLHTALFVWWGAGGPAVTR